MGNLRPQLEPTREKNKARSVGGFILALRSVLWVYLRYSVVKREAPLI